MKDSHNGKVRITSENDIVVARRTETLTGRKLQCVHNIRGRPGLDVVGSPAELQAEVSGRPRKTTGNQTQVRKTISHSLPSLNN